MSKKNSEETIIESTKTKSRNVSRRTVLTALFAAIICAGSFIYIPLPGGVPVCVQDMFAMLAGLLLGPLSGGAAVIVFLILGCTGLPVFTGKAGLHILTGGPTCGFLWGYLAAAVTGGLLLNIFLSQKKEHSAIKTTAVISVTALVQSAVLFALGIFGFCSVTGSSFEKAVAAVLLPFIPGNAVKIVLMILIAKKFRPAIRNYYG